MPSELRPESLAEALAKLQQDLPHIGKDKTARVTSKRTGQTHTYDYVNLATVSAAILPLMAPLGLSFTACPTLTADGKFVLDYLLRHTDGDGVGGSYPLPAGGTPQEIGSAITYARRYCLCAVTGVAPDDDDDDAQAAQRKATRPRARRQQPEMPEVDKHGAATLAEQTRMTHGAVDGVERLSTTPADDPWLSVDENGERREPGQLPKPVGPQPAKPRRQEPAPDGMAAKLPHVGMIVQHFGRLGVTDRAQRLNASAKIAGTGPITSSKDLSEEQARAVAEALSRCRDAAALVALMASLEKEMAPT